MGKCCSKEANEQLPGGEGEGEEEEEEEEEEVAVQQVLLEVDPGGGELLEDMTGGTLVVRNPGSRWQVTTTREVPIRRVVGAGPKNGSGGGGAVVTKTFRVGNGGTSSTTQSVVTFNGARGATKGTTVTKRVTTDGSPILRQKKASAAAAAATAGVGGRFTTTSFGSNNINNSVANNAKSSSSVFTIATPRMGKTTTETATRVYTKDGKRYQETVETVTKEDDDGNVTKTTKTTTKELDPFGTRELTAAIEHPKNRTTRGASRKSSTSSSDSSPDRKGTKSHTKTKPTEKAKSSKGGLIGKIKSKTLAGGGDKSSDSDSSDDEEFIEEVHKTINEHRKKHGVKPLKLSKEINKHAKEWAKKLAADEKLAHRPDNKYGENVYCVSSNSSAFKIKGKEVTDKWYSEIKDHVFGEEPKGSLLKSGHFSQMIWKDSKQVGIGYARSATGTKIFVVANFDPQGNWLGQFATQVPPVGGFTKTASKEKSTHHLPAPAKATAKSSSSSSSSSESPEEEDFAEECLKAHNNYRKKHGVPQLKLNKELSKFAKEWAQTIAKKNVLQHRDNNNYGENIYCAWSSNPNHKIKGSEAVESWYSEIKDYTFGREPADLRAGHFTQVVWQDSKELGVGYARSPTGKIFVVANYNPAGNYVGSFATKVPRPK